MTFIFTDKFEGWLSRTLFRLPSHKETLALDAILRAAADMDLHPGS